MKALDRVFKYEAATAALIAVMQAARPDWRITDESGMATEMYARLPSGSVYCFGDNTDRWGADWYRNEAQVAEGNASHGGAVDTTVESVADFDPLVLAKQLIDGIEAYEGGLSAMS